jgi:peptidoglycan/LPS O-acetylase OafA/YrhL
MITPKYRNDLDGLRGIAATMAVMFHAYPTVLTGGYIGVEIFFVISGFLIGMILLQSTADGSFTYSEFYSRRIRRIFPALVVMLGCCGIAGWFLLTNAEYRHFGKHIAAGAGFISNFAHWSEVNYFDTAADTKPLLHLWSLGVEEQFYIFLPPLLLLVARLRLNVRVVFGVMWVISYASNLYLTEVDRTQAFYSPLPRLWELFTGCLLASWFLSPPKWSQPLLKWRETPWIMDLIALIGMSMILIPMLTLQRNSYFPGPFTTPPILGTALLIAVGGHSRFSRKVLSHGSVTWLGRISYPMYLWHWPLISIAHMLEGQIPPPEQRALLLVIALGLAVITYYGVEQPMRFGRLRRIAVPLISTLLVIVAAGGAVIWQGDVLKYRAISQKEQVVAGSMLMSVTADQKYTLPACAPNPAIGKLAAEQCHAEGLEREGPLLVLWGDSHVRSWRPVFVEIARERGLRIVTFDHPACIPLLHVRVSDPQTYCTPELAQDIVQSIAALHADQVILISQWDLFMRGFSIKGPLSPMTHYLADSLTEGGVDRANTETSREAFKRQFPETVAALRATGADVLIIKAPPVLNEDVVSGFVRHTDTYEPTAEQHRKQTAFTSSLIDTVLDQSHVKALDPGLRWCKEKCVGIEDGLLLYGDDNHLTATASLQFKSELQGLVIARPKAGQQSETAPAPP